MKIIPALIVAIAVTYVASAQTKIALPSIPVSKVGISSMSSPDRLVADTLVGPSWSNPSAIGPSFIPAAGGGYVCGNNKYGDKQKAQAFINTHGTILVDGAIVWFRSKQHDAGATESKLQINEYSLDGGGTTNTGYVLTAPGTVNSVRDILFSEIDTGGTYATGAQAIMFTTPITTSSGFAISVNFSTLGAGDTVGLISSSQPGTGPPGDAMGTELAWEQWNTSAWHTLLESWGEDIDLFIWALVEDTPAGINENGFINGVRLYQNQPNPVNGNTAIGYELQNAVSNVSVILFDATGKLVRTIDEGNKSSGKHVVDIDVSALDAGVYYYALTAGSGRIAKKMIITK